MTKNNVLTKEDFDSLLRWFSPDRELAGAKYEEIRAGLIRFFNYKGCSEAENLADETINRVARKYTTLDTSNNHKYLTYFYGFATKIHLEYLNRRKKKQVEFEQNIHFKEESTEGTNSFVEDQHKCLETCLAKLSSEDRYLIIKYFAKDKSEKFEHRRNLAKEINLTMGALHVRVFRIKGTLKNCIEKCLKNNIL